jgi:hypothetical protein
MSLTAHIPVRLFLFDAAAFIDTLLYLTGEKDPGTR